MMRAVFHHPCDPWLRDRLGALERDDLQIDVVAEASGPALDLALRDADVLLHVLHPVTAAVMERAPRLKLVQKIGVGIDAIDLTAARTRGIAVCNMPGTNSQAVVELSLGLILSVLRRIPSLDHRLRREGIWTLPEGAQGLFGEVSGKVVGLVGYGQVARRLEPVVSALGAGEILVHSRGEVRPAIGRAVPKAEILAASDILSLHLPETAETRNWLDAEGIAAMKPGAIVVNSSRGAVIDEQALIRALRSGHLAGAGLDVFATEPLPRDAGILSALNVVALPHAAWLTRETLERSLAVAGENIARLAAGRDLHHRCA